MGFNNMKLYYILFSLIILFINQSKVTCLAVQPDYPLEFPSDFAYISQATSCFIDELENWTCPPCLKTSIPYTMLDYYSLTGIEQFIFVNTLYNNFVVAYRYSYSEEMKSQTLCDTGSQQTYFLSSDNSPLNDQQCIINTDFIVTSYISTIISSSSDELTTVLNLFSTRINEVILEYPFPRQQLIFTGYEVGGSIAQVVNSYYMIKNTFYESINAGSTTIIGCLPPKGVQLYQFGSPKTMNYVHDVIDQVCINSPLCTNSYLNSYWYLYNLVNYKDPVPTYPIGFGNNQIQYIQSVYYTDTIQNLYYDPYIIGFCDAKTDCSSQSPVIQNYGYILDNHYFIREIPFSPNSYTTDEFCNFYPEQLRGFSTSGSDYFSKLCQGLSQDKINECREGECAPESSSTICDCTPSCSFSSSTQPELPFECCMNICSVCTNPICIGEIPPISNTGATCSEAIELIPNDQLDVYTNVIVNVISPQPFGIQRPYCTPLFNSNPSNTVVWFKITSSITGQFEFNTFDTTFGSTITIWRDCQITDVQCLSSVDDTNGTDDGLVLTAFIKDRTYYISVTSDDPNLLGQVHLNYALRGSQSSFLDENIIINTIDNNKENNNSDYTVDEIENGFSSRDFIQSCLNRCSETGPSEIPGLCNCYSSCNPSIDSSCCSDICDHCTLGDNDQNQVSNEFCLAIKEGRYADKCLGRCNEIVAIAGCPCNLECVNNPSNCCLDFIDSCPQAEILQNPQFYSCKDRCSKDFTIGPSGEVDERYQCSCTEECETLKEGCCPDIIDEDINCPNKHVREEESNVSNSCFERCGNDPENAACSCEFDCQQQQNCCNDFCFICLPDSNTCDLNTNQLSLPPTIYEKQKYFQLSISPRCPDNGISKYVSWNCKSCGYYSGYKDVTLTSQYQQKINIFINYNANKKETIITLSAISQYISLDDLANLEDHEPYSIINYKDTRCPLISKNIALYYFTKYYTLATAIDLQIEDMIGGYENYFSNKKGGTLTFIGHAQAGAIANIIYDKFVMKRNIQRYYNVMSVCPTVSFGNCYAKYLTDTNITNAITVQGLTTSAPNIFYTIGALQYDAIFGESYNGNTTFNPNYRLFGVVNTFTFTSSILTGYSGLQTYYADPIGGVNIYPCNYYGSFCYPLQYVATPILIALPFLYNYGYAGSQWLKTVILSQIRGYELPFGADDMGSKVIYAAEQAEKVYDFSKSLGTMGIIGDRFVNLLASLRTWQGLIAANAGLATGIDIFSLQFNFFRDIVIYFNTNDIDNTLFNYKFSSVCAITGNERNIDLELDNFIRKIISKGLDNAIREYNIMNNDMSKQLGIKSYLPNIDDYKSNREIDINDVHYQHYKRYNIDFSNTTIETIETINVNSKFNSNSKSVSNQPPYPPNNINSYIYTGESTFISSDLTKIILIQSIDALRVIGEVTTPVLITGKPTINQFDKYYDFMSMGFAPYEDLQSFNCSLCQYYSGLGYGIIHWEHYTYYDLFWFSSPIRKEVIILMSTDNYPETIYESVCENRTSSRNLEFFSPIRSACIDNTNFYENYQRYYTADTQIMFPIERFNITYLQNDFTAQLMRNSQYNGYIYTYVGFGSSSAYIYDMYLEGFVNYNPINNTNIPYNSTCPQYHVQAVLFSPLGDFLVEEGTFNTFSMSDNVKVFMNPCDRLPTLGSFSTSQTPNCYEWNCPQSNLHSYYITDSQQVVDFNELSTNERECNVVLPNNTIINAYTVYPDHFTIGSRSPQYGFLRNAQQLVSNIDYESVVYQVPPSNVKSEICPLLLDYPYVNQSLPQVPLKITQPPIQLQQNKYYKLNLLSYGSYEQLLDKDSSWWLDSDIQNYTIVEQEYTTDWVLNAYYSSSNNELVISLLARNDTSLYGKSVCNSTESSVNTFEFIDTQDCTVPTVPWLYNNINNEDYGTYSLLIYDLVRMFHENRESTITFTGIGLGAGIHKSLLLRVMSYDQDYLTGGPNYFPGGSCILNAENLERYQSIFYSSTRNQYYQDPYNLVNDQVNRNITMSKFFTTVYISDDANFISAYDYLTINSLLFPTTLGPLWVYYDDQAVPILSNGNVNSLSTTPSRFYNTYYGFESPYYNQSNWFILGNNVQYIPASLKINNMYNIPVSNTDESCELLTLGGNSFNNTISTPPTIIESEIYSYFSMLAYCEVSQIQDGSCENLNQKGSLAPIIDTYELIGYSEDTLTIRTLYFKSDTYKSIIYAFSSNSDEATILSLECSSNSQNEFRQITYNVGLNCPSSEIGYFFYKEYIFLDLYSQWEPKSLFRDVVRNDINTYPDYKLVITGNSVGGSLAHVAFTDIQVTTLMNRNTCETNSNLQMIIFGELPSVINLPIVVGGEILKTTGVFSMINECDAVPYLYPNQTGYDYWILNPQTGKTYIVNPDFTLEQVTIEEVSQGNYSSCPFSNGYNIDPSNRIYIDKRSFVGYRVINSLTKYEYLDEENKFNESDYIFDDIDIIHIENLQSRDSLDNICASVFQPVTRIDYRGPTKSQLSKYNKLMSYSYYPGHPIIQNVSPIPPFINPVDVNKVLTDPQVSGYTNNDQSGEVFVGYHKIVYYTNYELKEFVISVVPVNTSNPYYYFSCPHIVSTGQPNSSPPYSLADSNYWEIFEANTDSMYKGNVGSNVNLKQVALRIRNIQQNIFESQILPGHGSKSDWTITFISKDTGNNAVLYFIFEYYYGQLSSENLGGINRVKVQNTGYKYFQTLGFGYILDKWLSNTNIFFDVTYPPSRNLVGKNIFMTVSIYNDLLNTERFFSGRESQCTDSYDTCIFLPNPCPKCQSGFIFDKWHRAILYDQELNMVEDLNYYRCNKYEQFIGPDTRTLYNSNINLCANDRTIVREYFGLPNYFYRYSQWNCGSTENVCTYETNYSGPFIEYDNPNYNICAPAA